MFWSYGFCVRWRIVSINVGFRYTCLRDMMKHVNTESQQAWKFVRLVAVQMKNNLQRICDHFGIIWESKGYYIDSTKGQGWTRKCCEREKGVGLGEEIKPYVKKINVHNHIEVRIELLLPSIPFFWNKTSLMMNAKDHSGTSYKTTPK